MDYLYNERSWLTQINHQNLYDDDKFGEVIGYNVQNHIASGSGFNFQAQYNGNISWNIMRTKDVGLEGVNAGYPDPIIGYVYNYDGANRLTKADFGYYNLNPDYTIGWSNSLPKAAMYDLPLVSYYANGNIFNLQRKGADALMMDNFTYFYQSNKNRLVSIMNTANGTQIYNYGYDNNGNVTSDQFRGIIGITYNISNLPEQLTADGSIVKYWYDNNGNRIRKQEGNADEVYVLGKDGETEAVFDADGSIKFFNILAGNEIIGRFAPTPVDLYLSNTILSGTYEAQNSITVENNVTVSGTTTLKAGNNIHLEPGFTAPGGTDFIAQIGTVPNIPKRYYYLKDHLGSIRVVVDETGDIVSYTDYDPWGMTLEGRSDDIGYLNSKYKFTGKERDNETGYDYFGARYYDSRIGRWMQVEPLYKKHLEWNPYNYVLDNPLSLIDPDGRQVAPWSIGMPMTLPRSWEELKIRTIAFLGMMTTTAAVYYAPEAIAGVAGWWMRNPVRANEIASGLVENLSNAPTGVGTVANIGKTYGKLGTVVEAEGMAFEKVLIEGHGSKMLSERGMNKNLLKDIIESPKVKLLQGNKEVFVTERGVAVIDPTNKNKLVTTYTKEYFDEQIKKVLEESREK